eukprot:GILI01025312.1.p1 GENE.GILI01025312.1~~GILI01025312.1.p1  ORF type:complete len:201 (-),score=48.19 GILI01025312.1:104-706(-)
MAAKLKRQQIQEYRDAFDMFDLDGGGTISNEELLSVFISLGQNPSQQEIEEMLPNGEEMKFEQFLELMSSRIQTNLRPEEIEEAFKVYDGDSDGLVDIKDLRGLLMAKAEKDVITMDELEALLVKMQQVAGQRVDIIDDVAVRRASDRPANSPAKAYFSYEDEEEDEHRNTGVDEVVDDEIFIDYNVLIQYMMRVSGSQT